MTIATYLDEQSYICNDQRMLRAVLHYGRSEENPLNCLLPFEITPDGIVVDVASVKDEWGKFGDPKTDISLQLFETFELPDRVILTGL